MSSMIKKKGSLSFKPKAPVRRAAGGGPISRNTSARPSIEPSVEPPAAVQQPAVSSGTDPILVPHAVTRSADQTQQDAHTEEYIETTPHGHVTTTSQDTHITSTTTIEASVSESAGAQEEPSQSATQSAVPTFSDETPERNLREEDFEIAPGPERHMYLEDPTSSTDVSSSVYPPPPEAERTPGPIDADLSALGAGQSNQATQIIPVAPLNPDGTSGDPITHTQSVGKPTKRRRRPDEKEGDIRPTIEVQIHKQRRAPAKNPRAPRNPDDPLRKRKKRAETPEDAEVQEVDHSTLKMADLCKDLKIGRKFSKHDEIVKRENERRVKAKFLKQHPELAEHEKIGNESTLGAEREITVPHPQMRVVDGQIVVDESSLVVDRHRVAAAAAPEMEEVEEDDFSKVTTSGTHMKRENNLYWSNMETEKFYDGLRMFGTDFEMISKMFPSRNRRQVKLKFNKEEREYPKKINSALIGEKVPIDMEEYQSHTGLQYEEVSAIEEEAARIEEEHEADQRAREEAAAEAIRQKKAEIQIQASLAPRPTGDVPAAGTESAKENEPDVTGASESGRAVSSKGKKKALAKGKKKRNLHSIRGGGEEVEVLGTIDSMQP